MRPHTKFLAIVLGSMLALCCSFQFLRGQATPPAAASSDTDHYQLDVTDTEIFVIDTTNGHVWSRPIKPRAGKWADEGSGPHGG